MDVHKMLEQVKAGQLDIAEAEAKLKDLPYEDLGYAKLDHHRKLRSGFGETIFHPQILSRKRSEPKREVNDIVTSPYSIDATSFCVMRI